MNSSTSMRRLLPVLVFLLISALPSSGQIRTDEFSSAFLPGREYFFLRSGNAQLILQADASGTRPALFYMLFDAERPCQTLRKERAFNYSSDGKCWSSALQVLLGGTPFTALPQNAEVHWRDVDGIPAVEARWWAGGVSVTEQFTALEGNGTFVRKITLSGKDLAGPDSVRLRLYLPPAKYSARGSMLVGVRQSVALGIGFEGGFNAAVNEREGYIESPSIAVAPGRETTVSSFLLTRIPLPGLFYSKDCAEDQPIPLQTLHLDSLGTGLLGLRAQYFNNPDLSGKPLLVRRDSTLSPYWDTGSPAPEIHPDSFSVRWTGFLRPPRTGLYSFLLVADDRARLYLRDTLVVNSWENSWNVRKRGELFLEAGKAYPVRVEFAELRGYAGMRLRWTVPDPPPSDSAANAGANELLAALSSLRSSSVAAAGTRTRWDASSHIETRDSLVQQLYDHARDALPGMMGETGAMDAGVFEYGDQWVRDGSNVALGLLHAGHFELARAVLHHILNDLVSDAGATISSGAFDRPDQEEFDQMGELMHALKAYRDWTGDTSLLTTYRTRILAVIERPLYPGFLDSTGMVHNRREYWERTFTDGYELAYQTFMVSGLRDAADLATMLGVPEKANIWRTRADAFLHAMLHHPTRSLVDQGALIKRRNVDGSVGTFVPGRQPGSGRDDPASTEAVHSLDPDASYALPITLHLVDPRSSLSRKTLDKLERIWNARWDFGGYERYHSSSQQDQPGPWTFATASIARAQQDAGLLDRSRRSLAWLLEVQGGNAGAWFEEIPLIRSQIPSAGIVPWTSAEVTLFAVRHWLGVSFEGDDLIIRPNLFPLDRSCRADLRFRSARLRLAVDRSGPVSYALVNGRKVLPRSDGSVVIPRTLLSGNLQIEVFARR